MNNERRQLSAANFIRNNGRVLRTINILRDRYNKLATIESVLRGEGVSEGEFLDSVNFLSQEGYIHLRDVANKKSAILADSDFRMLEANVTGKGIRLLAGGIDDNMIEL